MYAIILHRSILIWLLVFAYYSAHTQLPPLKFITYTTNDGLLHNFTRKCVEDHKGFIWVVSEIGLSRFDGVNFKNFQHDENDPASLPHNTIFDIAIDDEDRIWLATEKGLCYYSQKEACFSAIDIEGLYKFSPSILALTFDQRNRVIWFMTDKALYQINTGNNQIKTTSCNNPSSALINHLYLGSDNRLWIALYRNGFLLYDINTDSSTQYLRQSWVTCFFEGSGHTMWIGNWHSEQLVAWNMVTGEYHGWREKDEFGVDKNMIITGITRSPFPGDSLIVIASLHMGVRVFNTRLQKFTGAFYRDMFMKYSLPSDFTNSIYTDSRGIIWVCTWNGLSKMNILEQQFRTLELPFLNTPMFQYYNLIEGIVATDKPGIWWLGVNGCGIIKYDTAHKLMLRQLLGNINGNIDHIVPGTWTEFLIKTQDGTIWAGNDVGLARIDGDKVTQYDILVNNIHPWKKTICIDPDQTFWILTHTHLVHFDPKTGNYKSFEIDSSLHDPIPIRSVAEAGFGGDGMLWIGTIRGLFRFNTHTLQFDQIDINVHGRDSLETTTINSLVTDGNENVYIGTLAGLGIYNIITGKFQLKGEKDQVYPILWKSMLRDNEGNIWIYTPHSLFKYDPVKDAFLQFTTAYGIHNFSSDPAHLFSYNENFYIGYRGGFTAFDPLKVNINQTQVKPFITEVLIDGQPQHLDLDRYSDQYLTIPPGKKDISFHFTGIDFTNSDKVTFSYKLNSDLHWHELGTTRAVTFTHLEPGNYTFQLTSRNSSGILTIQPALFNLYIAPTLQQRWWFWPMVGIGFIFVVLLIANRRIRNIRKEEKLKTETNKMMAQLETKLLRSQMNPHFIFNSLNSIQKYIWENKEEDAAEYLARFAKLIRAILENSRKEFISLREELDVLKLYIELEHRRSNGKFDYHIQVAEDLRLDDLILPPLLLQPYIENAIWHGVNKKSGHGHIEINIQKENNSLAFVIDDDGVGRNFNLREEDRSSTGKVSMGTEITQQRINHFETSTSKSGVRIIDKETNGIPAGTTVIITLPVKYQAHA